MEWNNEINDIWKVIQNTTKNVIDLYPVIWKTSMEQDNREVQVVIDANDNIFSSIGNPSFVAFMEAPVGLKLPIKEWIHTHPFGNAYFSATDVKTVRTFEPVMERATVLGYNHIAVWTPLFQEPYEHFVWLHEDVDYIYGDEEE
jgi:proteasome lid subunit RPN8/RPN11